MHDINEKMKRSLFYLAYGAHSGGNLECNYRAVTPKIKALESVCFLGVLQMSPQGGSITQTA